MNAISVKENTPSELEKLQSPTGGDVYDDRDYWLNKAHELAREVDRLRAELAKVAVPSAAPAPPLDFYDGQRVIYTRMERPRNTEWPALLLRSISTHRGMMHVIVLDAAPGPRTVGDSSIRPE